METGLKHTESTLKDLIEVLHDGHKGFADIGEHLKDQSAKAFCMQESLNRQQMAGDLESELQKLGQHDAQKEGKIGGTTAGALHRTWGDFKAKIGIGDDDHGLLATAEQGEDSAKKAYEKALNESHLPSNIREIVQRQQVHVQASHDRVKAMRDSKKTS